MSASAKTPRAVWLAAAAISAITMAGGVQAQATPAAQTDKGKPDGKDAVLGEIVVTALRRTENLQNVPIAATTLNAAALTDKAVTRMSDLQFASPSLSITENGGLVQSANIRGIGLASSSPSVANGVAVYLDGLFQPPIVQTGAFYDMASVEVLRGPQGTLVGSNSTGGAIFINTANPDLKRAGGYLEASYGNYNTGLVDGAINLPVNPDLALRVAGQYRRHDSYYHDIGPYNNHPNRLDEGAGRVSLLWKPGLIQVLLKSQLLDHQTGGFAYQPITGSPIPANVRTLDYNSPTAAHEFAIVNSAEVKYNFANGITLRTEIGYQDKHANLLIDSDGSALATVATSQYVRERQASGEVNLISPATGPYNWILGGYYQRNQINVSLAQTGAGVPLNVNQEQFKYTVGVFGQFNYKFSDQLELQAGLRYSHYQSTGSGTVKIGAGIPGFPTGGLPVADLAGANADGRVTGKFAVNYHLDSRNLLYVFAARGYKPGGFNSAASTFAPETVWNYEAGWKSTLLGGHLRTQIDTFYNNYHGFQFGIVDATSGQNGVTNLPNATIKGIEVQAQAKFGGFSADAALSYNDSHLPAFSAINPRLLPPGNLGPQCAAGSASNPPTCYDYGPATGVAGGGPNLLSPRWTYNLGLQYALTVSDGASITPRLNFAHTGAQYGGLFYSPTLDLLPSYNLLSAIVTYRHGNWRIEAYGNNLANKVFVSGQSGNNNFYGSPREYGIRFNVDL